MQSPSNPVPTANTSYLNEEEFLAIVVECVYISAKGGTKFRANHFDDSVLWSPLDTSKGFVDLASTSTRRAVPSTACVPFSGRKPH
jgi:hypothetical protein